MAGKQPHQWIGLVLGAALSIFLQFLPVPEGLSKEAWVVVSLLVLMATWWVTEAIPIPVTSLLPLIILPLAGVQKIDQAAIAYSNKIVLLLMGGFIIAKSVERWHLHARLALNIVNSVGSKPSALVAGFMVASAFLSMWISNTATSIMLMPIAYSVATAVVGDKVRGAPFTIAVLLAVAYGASIGGLGTLVGTPTNLIISGYLEEQGDDRLSFSRWMTIGIPVVLVMLPAAWFVLTRWALKLQATDGGAGKDIIQEELQKLGKWTAPEVRVLVVFSIIAFFWIFRRYFIQDITIFGIQPFAGLTDHIIAIAGAVAMFLVPSGSKKERGTMLLDWETATKIPWGVLLLFGGGLSLAGAITSSGLADWLGGQMSGLTALPTILIMLSLVVFVIFATELTSNVATASALMPVVGVIAVAGGADPVMLAVPVAMAASCAFMLPMATGPNAIVFASGEVSISQMAKIGFRLNMLGILLITVMVYFLTPILFG
jgi:sodium-dependent dicarboxylate transporter 2/3/5